jgi:hypothetical protein
MQRRLVPIATLCATLAALAAPSFALELPAFDFSSPREKGMGGGHVALADDFSVLLSNPAGLADMRKVVSVADLGIQAMGPVFDIAGMVMGGGASATAITDFLAANNNQLYTGLNLTGPLAFGFTGSGLGFGLFSKLGMTVDVASVSTIEVGVQETLLLVGGYAFRFDLGKGHELSLGMNAKGFVRGDVLKSTDILGLVSLTSNLGSVLASPFTLTTGIGLDAGLRWAWKGLAAGLVCRDVYSPALVTTFANTMDFFSSVPGATSYATIKRSLDLGFAWSPELGRLGEVLDSLVIALDYRDILDLASPVPRNPILNVGLGVETRFLDIVSMRVGINEALLSAGMGLHLGVLTLNIAAYGAERGLDPGIRPYYNLLVDFDFKY